MSQQKDEIASAFERRFHHFGFRKTSVDDVARELKISKKTIYTCFESKEEIFRYLITQSSRRLFDQFSAGLETLPDDRARLEALVGMIFRQAIQFAKERDPLDFRFEIAEEAFREAYRAGLLGLIEQAARRGVGEPGSTDPEISVALIDGMITAGLRLAIAHPNREDYAGEVLAATIAGVLKVAG